MTVPVGSTRGRQYGTTTSHERLGRQRRKRGRWRATANNILLLLLLFIVCDVVEVRVSGKTVLSSLFINA